jgi:lipid-A-disaccharide synthase
MANGGRRRVLFVVGEPSGDAQAARLAEAMLRAEPGLDLYGTTGPQMRAAGVRSLVDIGELSIMGFSELAGGIGRALAVYRRLKRELRAEDGPSLVVLVDFPDFNIPLARVAKRAGRRVLYYVGPQVWAWRRGRIDKIAARVDRMIVLFPFEQDVYRARGVDVHFVGHPLAAEVRASRSVADTRRQLGVAADRPLVALLPGSRAGEVRSMLPVMLGAASRLSARAQFVVAVAAGVDSMLVERIVASSGVRVATARDDTYNLVAASDLAAVTSGTATVECALLGCPMVVVYRMSSLSYAIARALVRVPHIAMPNIVLGERVVPELVQHDAAPEPLAAALEHWLDDTQARAATAERLRELRGLLVREDAADRAAMLALELIA